MKEAPKCYFFFYCPRSRALHNHSVTEVSAGSCCQAVKAVWLQVFLTRLRNTCFYRKPNVILHSSQADFWTNSGLFLFLGPQSSKSSRTASVKIVAVAQSKLAFIKPTQNGISKKKAPDNMYLLPQIPSFYFYSQPSRDTLCLLLQRTCSMMRGGSKSSSRVSPAGLTTCSPQMNLK